MNQKWNLQDIRPPRKNPEKRMNPVRPQQMQQDIRQEGTNPEAQRPQRMERMPRIPIESGRNRRRKKLVTLAGVFLVLIVVAFGISSLLRGAEVTVYPKSKQINVEATFTASKNAPLGSLGFELLSLSEEGERVVTANGKEEVTERASGIITVYNGFSTSPQRLIKNTRFESSNGLVYRISDSIDIPGYKEDSKGEIVPGSITTKVFADGTGENYNIAPGRFSVPGLTGTEQYDSIYAESFTPFSGGFEGMKFIINETELATSKQELHMELRDKLLKRLPDERPAGFELFKDSVTFVYETLPSTQAGSDTATIKERVQLVVPLFAEKQFAEFIAQNSIPGYEGKPVHIENPQAITFSYPKEETNDLQNSESIEFSLSGKVRVIWSFDQEKLRNDLVGVSKTALSAILTGYPAIDRAGAVVRPFWSRSFPNDSENIEIIEVLN